MIRRPPTLGLRGMVVASHPLAAEAGVEMLRAGGHAVDAAIAAAAVLSVVEPGASGLGGDAFFLIHDAADGAASAVNGSGAAPRALTTELFARSAAIPARTPLAITVPGCVAAWDEAAYGWGRLAWDALLAPARRLAEEGFAVSWRLARVLRRERAVIAADPGLAGLYLDARGAPLSAGAICRPRALARTLSTLAEDGAESFYRGAVGARLSCGVRDAGGVLSVEDLAAHESDLRAPIELSIVEGSHRRGRSAAGNASAGDGIASATRAGIVAAGELEPHTTATLLQQPLPSQGIVLLIALGILQELGPSRGALEAHRQVTAVRLAFAVRDLFLGDPRSLPAPEEELPAALLAPETLRALAALVRDRAAPGGPPAVDPSPLYKSVLDAIVSAGAAQSALAQTYRRANLLGGARAAGEGPDTTYLCAVDGEGNAAGLIQSIYHPFGAGFLEPATGIIPNNRGAGFSLHPESPNRLAPGRRALHTLNSWMLLRDGAPWILGGTPGAQNQIAVNVQVLRACLAGEPLWPGPAPMLHGRWTQARRDEAPPDRADPADPIESIPAALEAPRWDFDPLGRVRLESRFPAEVRRRLQRMGHEPVRGGPWDGAGFVQVIARLREGVSLGATDPRGEGAALGL